METQFEEWMRRRDDSERRDRYWHRESRMTRHREGVR